jgi:Ca2+-binding RTX toxin-like protein
MALVFGNTGSNTLSGTAGDDAILGFGGNDTLTGDAGNDGMSGGPGADVMEGGSGNDAMDGGTGNDELSGQGNNDVLFGVEGDDELFGGGGNDTLQGGDGNDDLGGGGGNDTVQGGEDNDTVDGGGGDDRLFGGSGEPGEVDVFDFDSTLEADGDVIEDFDSSALLGQDDIDLRTIDADENQNGNQAFDSVLLEDGDPFTAEGQIRISVNPSNISQRLIELNTDEDDTAEATIVSVVAQNFLASDFLL